MRLETEKGEGEEETCCDLESLAVVGTGCLGPKRSMRVAVRKPVVARLRECAFATTLASGEEREGGKRRPATFDALT